jgi:2-alkyl-3-oxoalkanoate reductase
MQILVTGATGVVGAHALPQLLAAGHSVTGVGRSESKRAQLEATGARAIALDMFDREQAREALRGYDTVINLATHMPSSVTKMLLPWEWRENDRVRREGSAALVDAAIAAGVSRFIQESFAPIYEDGGDRWIDESSAVRPAPYNQTVLDAEASAARFTNAGRTGVVLRFAGFYGPDQVLRDLLEVVKKGWSPLPGAGDAYWSSVAHVDAASATVAALTVPAGIYNVCDDDPLVRREWLDVAAAAIHAEPPRSLPHLLAALGGKSVELLSRSQRMSNAKLKGATGWSPQWRSAREGLPAAIKNLAEHEGKSGRQ